MNNLYQERFPKATHQMEVKLNKFIQDHENLDDLELDHDNIAIVRFVHHQLLEMARDCVAKSREKLVTSGYFYEMSENLEKLLLQTRDKSPEAAAYLTCLIKKLLLIVSRLLLFQKLLNQYKLHYYPLIKPHLL